MSSDMSRLRLRDVRHISAFRLTVSIGIVFALGLVALLASIYFLTARELVERSDRILRQRSASLLTTPAAELPDRIAAELRRDRAGLSYYGLMSSSGELVIGNIRTTRRFRADRPIDVAPVRGGHGPLRLLASVTPRGETILVGRDTSQIVDLRERVLVIVLVGGVVITLGVLAAGAALSMGPLGRVRALKVAANRIASGDLRHRMPIAGLGDELDQLAGTVNAMIGEVERVVGQVKGVTDALAHDLRTPLTRVRVHLYRAARASGTPPDTKALIDWSVDDLDAVLARFTALLRLSELEASGRRAGFDTVDLAALIRGVCELYEPLAEDREIFFVCEATEQMVVEADEKLLFEAVSNLVDNAIKFTHPGGTVALRLVRSDDGPAIEVRDDGPGIPADERDAVLRRFARGSGAGAAPGSGLGLSIVAAITHLHGFRLDLADARPGLVVQLRMTGRLNPGR